MWAQAANHLISQINGVDNLPKKIKANVNLVIRESSAAAPKR
jgi:DNA-binding LacI/PurR family transcriptional regulator